VGEPGAELEKYSPFERDILHDWVYNNFMEANAKRIDSAPSQGEHLGLKQPLALNLQNLQNAARSAAQTAVLSESQSVVLDNKQGVVGEVEVGSACGGLRKRAAETRMDREAEKPGGFPQSHLVDNASDLRVYISTDSGKSLEPGEYVESEFTVVRRDWVEEKNTGAWEELFRLIERFSPMPWQKAWWHNWGMALSMRRPAAAAAAL